MIICKNCEHSFDGKFCPNCSQKANTHRFTLGHLAHELFHAFTHTDKGILFLIKELFTKPGTVAKEYNAGKRKKYFNPFTFLLIGIAVQIFAVQKTNFFIHFNNQVQESVRSAAPLTKEESETFDHEMDRVDDVSNKVQENNKLLNFVLIPVLALLTWLFFWKSGYNYVENLVFSILVTGQLQIYFLLFCILPFLLFPSIVIWLLVLYYLIYIVYSLIGYKQFYNQGWGKTIFKGLVIQIIYMVIVQQITFLMVNFIL
jgi:hypothetical protein